jgi:hypothetical protein
MRRKHVPRRAATSLLDLVAADAAEYTAAPGRVLLVAPRWAAAEITVVQRFARGVLSKKYRNAVLAVEPCRAALGRVTGTAWPGLRTRQSVHRKLILVAIELGRVKSRVRWKPEEKAILDRFATAVAEGRMRTARGAGKACAEALCRLHRRYPEKFAGAPDRKEAGIQGELWPRVAKLCSRWFNSQWSVPERAIVDRHARALIAHRYPHVRAAARVCCEAINRMHARLRGSSGRSGPVPVVRTLSGVSEQVWLRARELAPLQLPHRHWSAEEWRVADRWAHRHELHMRGRLRMNLETMAGLMQAELGRKGYYRNVQACVTAIVTRRRELGLGRQRPRSR